MELTPVRVMAARISFSKSSSTCSTPACPAAASAKAAARPSKTPFAPKASMRRAAAEAETLHALAHLANMGGVGTTLQNLEAAVKGETYEFTEMYPPMVEQAKAEGHKARTMLDFANRAEKVHAGLFQQALQAMKAGKDLSQMDVYLCPVCGDVEFGVPPDKCPICGAPASKFQKIA